MIKNRFVILALSLVFFTPCHAEQKFQSHDSIYALVKETIARNINTSAEYEISVFPLDSQLKLPECTEPLEVFKATELIKAGRASIGVRCNAEKKWSIFASAVIKAYETVIVLSRPVQRGEIITTQHLAVEKGTYPNSGGILLLNLSRPKTSRQRITRRQALSWDRGVLSSPGSSSEGTKLLSPPCNPLLPSG